MNAMDIQRTLPAHLAIPVRLGAEAGSDRESGACLLYAGHRLLRWLLSCRDGWSGDWALESGFEGLSMALLERETKKGEKGHLIDLVKKSLDNDEAVKAVNDLTAAAELFLSPGITGGEDDASSLVDECRSIVERLADAFEPVWETIVATGGPDSPDTVYGWACGGGYSAFGMTHGCSSISTLLVQQKNKEPLIAGPAAPGEPPGPLIACAGPDNGQWWECPEGLVYDDDGRPAAPLSRLDPAGALGRLLFWNLAADENPVHEAERMVDTGLPEAGGALLTLSVSARSSELTSESLEEIEAFLEENELTGQRETLNEFLLDKIEKDEARLREEDDMKGLSDALLKRQQMESGRRKVLTLSRLANLFRDKLDDRESGLVCLLSALEEAPDDEAILSDLLEEAAHLGKGAETAPRLLDLAQAQSGAVAGTIARAAGTLFMEGGNTDASKARDAFKIALDVFPDDHALLMQASDVAVELKDHDWIESLLSKRRETAPDNSSRLEAILELGVLLHEQLDRTDDAADEYKMALVIDPNHEESFEAMIGIYLKAGRPEDARRECEDLLGRSFDPKMRARVLRRLASLLIDVFKEDAPAAGALSEAFFLDPEDRSTADLLGTLYEGLGEWKRLVGFLRRRVKEEPGNAVSHLLQMAEIASRNIKDTDAALGFLTEAAALDPDDPEPARRIRRLHEDLELWAEVARDIETGLDGLEPREKTETLKHLGDLYIERLSLRGRGKDAFWRALETAPEGHVSELAHRLVDLHKEDGESDREAEALQAAVGAESDDERAADLYTEMARLATEPPADRKTAKGHLEKAVELNPVHRVAVEQLAAILLEDDEPERVIPLVEPLASKAAEEDDDDDERRLRLLGAGAAMKVSDTQGAITQYARVIEIDPTDFRTSVILGRLQAESGQDARASRLLSGVLEHADESLTPMDRIEVLNTAAGCASRQGDHARALEMLDSAYRLKGGVDVQTLRELVDSSEKAGDTDKLCSYLEELVAAEPKGPQRFADKMKLGDACRGALDDPAGALNWYQEAAYEGVSPKTALHKALDAAIAAGEHDEATSILKRILEVEQDGVKRAEYHYALALHVMEHVKDSAATREHLWASIELNPDQEDAVKALENVLVADHDEDGIATLYQLLARHYRLTGQDDKLKDALRKLARGYDERLKNPVLAAEALRQLLAQAPTDMEAATRLADVLTASTGKEKDALGAHRRVIEMDPTREESYRAIRDLCVVLEDEDGAWTSAAALKVLGHATEADAAAFEDGRQPALMLKRDYMPEGTFERLILDKGADPGLARVLAILFDPLSRILPWKQPGDLGLSDSDILDMKGKGTFQNMAAASSKILGIPLPRVYRAKGMNGLAKLAFNPPALAAGDDVMEGWRGKELRFGVGRALASFAPGFQLAGISDVESLRLFFLAALSIAFPDYPVPDDASGVQEMARDLGKSLTPGMRSEILEIMSEFRRDQKSIDSQVFLQGVDKTASRAGLFLANDLYVAGGLLSDDALNLSDLEYGDRVTDLCAWTVSEKYATLRSKMLRTGEEKG